MAAALAVIALKAAILPGLASLSVLLVSLPLSLVEGVVRTDQLTEPVLLIVFPVADVVAAIRVHHAPMTVMLIVDPVPIIMLAVCPDLVSFAVPA